MRRPGLAAILPALLLLAACAGTPMQGDVDPQKSAELNAELGLRYMLNGKNELALQKLERALEYDPDSAQAHHYLGELYRRLEKPELARDHYRAAIGADPKYSAARNNYAAFLCSEGDAREGERQFLKVLDNPVYERPEAVYENLALCMRRAGEPAKAESYFRQALDIDPGLPQSLFAMAELQFEQGDHLSARAHLQRYQEVARHTPRSLWLGVRIEQALGDKDAVASYGMLLEGEFPESDQAQRYRNEVAK